MKKGPKQALNAECSVYVCVHWTPLPCLQVNAEVAEGAVGNPI